MTSLYLLIPLSILFLIVAIWLLFWASSDGQFDDLESPAVRILMDDDETPARPQNQELNSDAHE